MRRLRICSVALMLALLSGAARGANPPIVLNIPTAKIPVIKTEKELGGLDAIHTGEEEVRVGIEADTCDLGAGVLVYVATSGKPKPRGTPRVVSDDDRKITGPVIVEIKPLDRKVDKHLQRAEALEKLADLVVPKGPLYYVCPLQPSRAGKYEVRVVTHAGDVLAKTTLTATDKTASRWYAVSVPEIDYDGKKTARATVQNRPSVPDWDPRSPHSLGTRELPRMMPPEDGAGFALRARGNLISAELNRNIADDQEEVFMARVWINGRPAAPSSHDQQELMEAARAVVTRKGPVKFSLRVDVAALGARKGDKVTLQLAFCPMGTKQVVMDDMIMMELMKARMLNDELAFPIISVSNTVEFTVK